MNIKRRNCLACKLRWYRELNTNAARNGIARIQTRIQRNSVSRLSFCLNTGCFEELCREKDILTVLKQSEREEDLLDLQAHMDALKVYIESDTVEREVLKTLARKYLYRMQRFNTKYGTEITLADAVNYKQLIKQSQGYQLRAMAAKNFGRKKKDPVVKREIKKRELKDGEIRVVLTEYDPNEYILGDEELPV